MFYPYLLLELSLNAHCECLSHVVVVCCECMSHVMLVCCECSLSTMLDKWGLYGCFNAWKNVISWKWNVPALFMFHFVWWHLVFPTNNSRVLLVQLIFSFIHELSTMRGNNSYQLLSGTRGTFQQREEGNAL